MHLSRFTFRIRQCHIQRGGDPKRFYTLKNFCHLLAMVDKKRAHDRWIAEMKETRRSNDFLIYLQTLKKIVTAWMMKDDTIEGRRRQNHRVGARGLIGTNDALDVTPCRHFINDDLS